MTYQLNPELTKIESPVILVIEGNETAYPNGKALTELSFDTNYVVKSIAARHDCVVVTLQPNERINDINWAGEEQISFF